LDFRLRPEAGYDVHNTVQEKNFRLPQFLVTVVKNE
jgi:hypothetical protein